jgi:hypothetical protein
MASKEVMSFETISFYDCKVPAYVINDDFTPAAFWVRFSLTSSKLSTDLDVDRFDLVDQSKQCSRSNAVAASSHAGYQYNLLASVSGLSNQSNPTYRPDREVFGRFINNTVHSCGTYGVRLAPQYIPIAPMQTTLTTCLESCFKD